MSMNDTRLQLNADLGEGCGNDAAIMPFIDAANIACGGHAGNADSIEQTIALAIPYSIALGAHPSFPDKAGFGRQNMQLSQNELSDAIGEQLQLIERVAQSLGVQLSHIKPHGALYNQASSDSQLADQLLDIFAEFNPMLSVVGLAGGELVKRGAARGLATLSEGFADRRYQANGQLATRGQPHAVIENPAEAIAQVNQILRSGTVTAIDNSTVTLLCDTLCLHGDGTKAIEFARQVAQIVKS